MDHLIGVSYRAMKSAEENEKLKPISLKMLQGAFYVIIIGHGLAGDILNKDLREIQEIRVFLFNTIFFICGKYSGTVISFINT